MVRTVGGQQARLGADEGDGVAGANAGFEGASAIGIEAGRAVQRQQRAGVAHSQRIGGADPFRVVVGGRPGQSDAEQAVDNE